jgi:TatD DNase family protein
MHYLIDSHFHPESVIADGTFEGLLERADAVHVKKMIAVGTEDSDWSLYQSLASKYEGRIFYTVGLHPCHVDAGWESQVSQLKAFFESTCHPVALGEIGLDYFRLPKDAALANTIIMHQEAAFRAQLDLAVMLGCPVVVHSRAAFYPCMRIIEERGLDWQKVVFHCFVEGPSEMHTLNERGARGSFTGIVTYKNADAVRAALLEQGMDSLMIETDAPYLAPDPHRGKVNEPAYLPYVAEACAALFGADLNTFRSQIAANTERFYGI